MPVTFETLALLALAGLVGGIGITALGPGGIVITVALYAVSGLSPATIAGTAIATHVATGAVGTAAYLRTGELRQPGTRRLATTLVLAGFVGTPLGVVLNGRISHSLFGVLLGGFVVLAGLLVLARERRTRGSDLPSREPRPALAAAIGVAVATAAGVFGLGGPLLSVPLLVACGCPMLGALGAAQAQSVVIAGTGTLFYALRGDIDWKLAAAIGVPELLGVLIGARIAHAIPVHRLRLALAAALLVGGAYLALRG